VTEHNWSGTYTYRARALHRPSSVAELQEIVGGAEGPVHALGTRHSFNDLADAAELISLTSLRDAVAGADRIVIDPAAQTVTVPGDIRYGDLARQLQAEGWALANLASLPHISVAGSIATATHGSGNANRSLASAVARLTLVTGTGELVTLNRSSPDLAGAVVGLGALGVVTAVTLAIEPTFDVRQDVYEGVPWDRLTGSFEEVMGAGYSVSAITDFADDVLQMLWVKSRVTRGGPSTMPSELFGGTAATEKLHLTRGNDPRYTTPQLGDIGPWCDRLPHFLLEFTPSSGAEIQSEYLMDRRHAGSAIEAMRRLGGRIAPLLRSAEIRTVAADELWLSHAYRQDTFGIHFTWLPDTVAVASIVGEIEAALAPFGPRPHWAKVFGDDHDWAALYPRLGDFRDLVRRFDPRGVFRNRFLDRTVFG
jgi:xylitol oxidase